MNKSEKQTVREVLDAMDTHHTIIVNNITFDAKIGRATMKDIECGMAISIGKLNNLLKNK